MAGYDWRNYVAQGVKAPPKKKMVVTGRHSTPREVKDPVTGFLHSATSFVKDLAHDVGEIEHKHNVNTKKQFASDTKHITGGDVVGWMKKDWKNTWDTAKGVYHAVDKYGDERQEAVLHPHKYQAKHPNEKQQLELTPGLLGTILQTGKFFFKPGEEYSLEKALGSVSKNYGGKDPFRRLPNVAKHLPEKPPEGFPAGVGGRIPFLVHQGTGKVAVGNFGESHGEIGAKLMERGVHVQRRALGGQPHPEDWLEGWIHPVHGAGQEPHYAMHLSTRGLDGYHPPDVLNGLRNLVQSLTRDVKDSQVAVKTKAGSLDDTRAVMAARQGEGRMASLEKKLPKMSEKEFMDFLEAELKRKRPR